RYSRARLLSADGLITSSIPIGQSFTIELEFQVAEERLFNPSFGVVFESSWGQPLLRLITRETHGEMPTALKGGIVSLHVERVDLLPGNYSLNLGISNNQGQQDWIESAMQIEITSRPIYPTGKLPRSSSSVIYAPCTWTHNYA